MVLGVPYNQLPSCIVNLFDQVIHVTCSSLRAGFQVIAQLSNANEVQKLYVNQSMDPYTSVTVEVERDGPYEVTIFPITEGRGILYDTVKLKESSMTTTIETVSSIPTTLISKGTVIRK